MPPTRFRVMIPVLVCSLALVFSACGFKGDLYLPGKDDKKGHNTQSTDKKP
ncbi:MAG: lipoprotein [Magnetococcales bacterium]|nr:lipoprotein [Magnetococcales bacterium]